MRRIEWNKNLSPEQQELKWMKEFVQMPFHEKFSFVCKLQMMEKKADSFSNSPSKRIEWI